MAGKAATLHGRAVPSVPDTLHGKGPRMSDTPLARLRWRCRRGTKELDALYGWWLENRYAEADADTRAAFEELLEVQDPDLWDWTIGRGSAPRSDWQAIIDDIRARHRL